LEQRDTRVVSDGSSRLKELAQSKSRNGCAQKALIERLPKSVFSILIVRSKRVIRDIVVNPSVRQSF